jgi:molybdenum cofactor cytidylyltransferase
LKKEKGIWALILAAGESKRMNQPKLVMPFGDNTIIENVIGNIPGELVEGKIIVLGAWMNEIQGVIGGLDLLQVYNEDYKKGMLSSVRCGVRALPSGAEAVIIYPGDQPGIAPGVSLALIRARRKSGKGILISVHGEKRGHPILIDKKYFYEINTLNDERGLRELSSKHPDDVLEVKTRSKIVLRDIDTPEDYLEAIK